VKILPALLLNVVVVAAGLFVYDHVRDGDSSGGTPVTVVGTDPVIEARLAALEQAGPAVLRTDGAQANLLRRLEALEQRAEAKKTRLAPLPDSKREAEELGARKLSGEELSEQELARYRKLRSAVRADDKAAKQAARIDRALAKLDIRLSKGQRAKLAAAQQSFMPRYIELWGEAKTRAADQGDQADWKTVIAETGAVVQREFSDSISGFLPQADADAIAAALHPTSK